MQSSTELRAYARTLKSALEAKDVPQGVRGSVMFDFPGDGQLTIDLSRATVRVEEGDTRDADLPWCRVKAPLATWLAVCSGARPVDDPALQLLGDHELLGIVAQLIRLRRSALGARFFS